MNIAEIKAIIDAATPEPWQISREEDEAFEDEESGDEKEPGRPPAWIPGVIEYAGCGSHIPRWREEDAQFVTKARMLMPKLLAVAEAVVNGVPKFARTPALIEALAALEAE